MNIKTLFNDFRGQFSWGRLCAMVCLVVAVWREFTGGDIEHVSLWLGGAVGGYGTSKGTEVIAYLKGFFSVPTKDGGQ